MVDDTVWQNGVRLFELFALADAHLSDRQRRLFAVACCRRFLFSDPRSRRAIDVAEQFANGLIGEEERRQAEEDAFDAHIEMRDRRLQQDGIVPWSRQAELLTQAAALAISVGKYHAEDAADYARWALAAASGWRAEQEEEAVQCQLLREIVGPLPRPVIAPLWRSHAVLQLAQTIHIERAFGDLPILGDALEEAGCTDPLILAHCREPGEHVLGCWVVDQVLGKE